VKVRQSTGAQGGATVDLTAVELRALVNILSFVASGGVTTERPEREMAARLRAELETALGELPAPSAGSASVCGFQVPVTVGGQFQYPFGWLDLWLRRLENRIAAWGCPRRERVAEVVVVRVFRRDHLALPLG